MPVSVRSGRARAAALLLALGLGACELPFGSGERQARGIALLDDQGSTVAQYHDGRATGSVQLRAGETAVFQVRLLDPAGVPFPLPGSTYSLRQPTVILTALATASLDGVDRIRVTARAAGGTSLLVHVERAGDLAFDAPLPLRVH